MKKSSTSKKSSRDARQSEESRKQAKKKRRRDSDSDSFIADDESVEEAPDDSGSEVQDDDEDEAPQKSRKAQPSKTQSKKSKKKGDSSEDEEEEYNAEDWKGLSRQKGKEKDRRKQSSGSDDEEGSSSAESFHDEYDEDLYKDEEDKERLQKMTEMEREMILAERAEQRQQKRERWELLQKRKEKGGRKKDGGSKPAPSRGRKDQHHDGKDEEDSDKEDEEKSEEEEEEEEDDDDDEEKDKEEDEEEEEEDKDKDKDEEEEEQVEASSSQQAAKEEPVKLANILPVVLKRQELEEWLYEKNFAEYVRHLFVRYGLGIRDGQNTYRLCEITGVQQSHKIYKVGNSRTDQMLVLRGATSDGNIKALRMDCVSNTAPTQDEFDKWVQIWSTADQPLPSLADIQKRGKHLDNVRTRARDHDDLQYILAERERLGEKPKNLSVEKSRLTFLRDQAQQDGDAAKALELTHQIEEIDRVLKKRMNSEVLSKTGDINTKSRLANIEKQRTIEAFEATSGKNLGKDNLDPFARTRTQPTSYFAKPADDAPKPPPKPETPVPRAASPQAPSSKPSEAPGTPADPRSTPSPSPPSRTISAAERHLNGARSPAADLVAAHNVNLDIPIDAILTDAHDASMSTGTRRLRTSMTWKPPQDSSAGSQDHDSDQHPAPRHILSLKDYKRRLGLL